MKIFLFLLLAVSACGADFRAGVARIKITPETPIWMSGYASRKHPSEGVTHDLWAKALAVDDGRGGRVVLVTVDVIGLSRPISDLVAARVQKEYGLDRASLVLNAAHTHTGPVLRANLAAMYDLDAENVRRIEAYSRKLADDLTAVIGAALGDLRPARLWYGHGSLAFAVNRREPTAKGMKIGVNPNGPTDPEMPLLKVTAPDGSLRAVLFGYACHNTTLGGDFYRISGDYAGFAQIAFEKAHPGVTGMFLMLCGADQNPNPRGTLELAEKHGQEMAAEVGRVLSGPFRRVGAPVRAAFQTIELPLAPHTRETFTARLQDRNPYVARNARLMLEAYDQGRPLRRVPFPVQAVRFGKDLTLIALGGEVVVDYALRSKREFGANKEPLVVLGYSNEVMCYIPTRRVVREGGYEAVDSMYYYGMPGPFSEDVEEDLFAGIRGVLKRVGRRAPAR